jgi:hypothetical protein
LARQNRTECLIRRRIAQGRHRERGARHAAAFAAFAGTTRCYSAKASDSRLAAIAMASLAACRSSRTRNLYSRLSRLSKPRSTRDILKSRALASLTRSPRAIATAHASSDSSAPPIPARARSEDGMADSVRGDAQDEGALTHRFAGDGLGPSSSSSIHPGVREFCCLRALGLFSHPSQDHVPPETPLAANSKARNPAFSKQFVNS